MKWKERVNPIENQNNKGVATNQNAQEQNPTYLAHYMDKPIRSYASQNLYDFNPCITYPTFGENSSSVYATQQVAEIDFVGCGHPHSTDACPLNTKTIAYVKMILTPTLTMQVGETILTSVGKDWVRVTKGDKVVKNIIMVRFSVIAKDIMKNHTTQCPNVNKPPPLLHPYHLWNLFFVSISRGMMYFCRVKPF
ncbi:hypothetical protein E6C27_scaffold133G001090 [Cucumis melo var. makuwa]|uniref:Uncharacterized protein n=1 Tax=Cucumis melo var. makuwa TaxID=1194695 RepID=A0A5A7U2F0_CUCMM|nr:hypothetical protein E6C27_scaffold133G001090 [Cucumis melo var. makuwa]